MVVLDRTRLIPLLKTTMKQRFYKEILVRDKGKGFSNLLCKLKRNCFVLKRDDLLSIFVKSEKEEAHLKELLKDFDYKLYPIEKPNIPPQNLKSYKLMDFVVSRKGISGKKCLIIKPGIAFGYDHLASTLMAEILIKKSYLYKNMRALDIGTGSGILSIIMAKKGARKVISTDICPYIVKEAIENIRKNKIRFKKVEVKLISTLSLKKPFFFAVANVPENIHLLICRDLERILPKNRYLLIGGFQKTGLERIKHIYKNFNIIESFQKEGWFSLLLQR